MQKFYCEKCDYNTCHKNDFTKHCQTIKHRVNNFVIPVIPEQVETIFSCETCGKGYHSAVGLWKHTKKCNKKDTIVTTKDVSVVEVLQKENEELKMSIFRRDEEFKNLIIELCKSTQTNVQNNTLIQNNSSVTNNNTTHNNNSFNLNFFLNETCKDALNMSDFIKSIQVGFEDIERIGNIGYVDGISGLIIKSLQQLGVERRPIHCTDAKRQTLYIKENNEWTKEDSDWSHLQHMVDEVQKINLRQLPAWREQHPNCLTSTSKYTTTYNTMSQELMGGDCKKVKIQVKDNKIMSRIMKEVIVDKSLFLT
jgi:hypothetical protein